MEGSKKNAVKPTLGLIAKEEGKKKYSKYEKNYLVHTRRHHTLNIAGKKWLSWSV